MTNRRQFLSGCSTLALAATFSPAAFSAVSIFPGAAGLDQLTYATLSECLGSTFVARGTKRVALELTRADQWQSSSLAAATAPDAGNEKFSLLFRGSRSEALPEKIYAFEHSRIGRFEMFIAPVGAGDQTHIYYEAVFNRPAGRGMAA